MQTFTEKLNATPLIGTDYPTALLGLIDHATATISILMFDWRWYPNGLGSPTQLFNQALVRAVRRGVKIKVVVNSDQIVETLKSVGIDARKIRSRNLLHSKLVLIDGEHTILGSHNISASAFETNFETSVHILSLIHI